VLDDRDVTVIGAGRTDAGVHALGQVAAFSLERAIDAGTLVRALNARLPDAVRVLSAAEVSATFNPRFDARAKSYRYRIWNAPVLNPFERGYAWHVVGELDVETMGAAAARLEGRHDFASFQAAGSDVPTTDRTIASSRVMKHSTLRGGALITYAVTGDGFLRHMVRTIAGTLVEIGRGRRRVEWIDEVLALRDRAAAGPTAPAHGLFLVAVEYGEPEATAERAEIAEK
jgi:tRNA pseudouridine38-40 synthase